MFGRGLTCEVIFQGFTACQSIGWMRMVVCVRARVRVRVRVRACVRAYVEASWPSFACISIQESRNNIIHMFFFVCRAGVLYISTFKFCIMLTRLNGWETIYCSCSYGLGASSGSNNTKYVRNSLRSTSSLTVYMYIFVRADVLDFCR